MNRTKLYKFINTIISILIAIVACWYLFFILVEKVKQLSFISILETLNQNIYLAILIVLLMPLNWLCEIVKWRRLISKIETITYNSAFKCITLGVTIALLTPNGIGELGGRLVYISKKNRVRGLHYGTFLSLSQLLVTLLVGSIGILNLMPLFFKELGVEFKLIGFQLFVIITCMLLLYLYFFSSLMKQILTVFKKTQTTEQFIIEKKDRLYILLISGFRYFVFATQFILLLQIFDQSINYINAFLGVSLVYLITAIIPTAWISDLIVRTSIAYFVFSKMGYSGEAAILSSSILWVVNLFVPAIIGLLRIKDINWVNIRKQLRSK